HRMDVAAVVAFEAQHDGAVVFERIPELGFQFLRAGHRCFSWCGGNGMPKAAPHLLTETALEACERCVRVISAGEPWGVAGIPDPRAALFWGKAMATSSLVLGTLVLVAAGCAAWLL